MQEIVNMCEFEGHTPGPWKLLPMSHAGACDMVARRVVQIEPQTETGEQAAYVTHSGGDEKVNNANSELIAAAPDLLAERDQLRAENERLLFVLGESLTSGALDISGLNIAEENERLVAQNNQLRSEVEQLRSENKRVSDYAASLPLPSDLDPNKLLVRNVKLATELRTTKAENEKLREAVKTGCRAVNGGWASSGERDEWIMQAQSLLKKE